MATTGLQLDPEEVRRNLAITLGNQQGGPMSEHLGLPAGPQMAAPSINPPARNVPNLAISTPTSPMDTLKAQREKMLKEGSGESQIYGKVTGSQFGQAHPLVGKILGGLGQVGATLGDIGLSAVAPGIAAAIPGTAYHHAQEVRGVNKQIGAEETEGQKEAQIASTRAEIPLHQAQTEHEQAETAGLPAQQQAALEHTQAETEALNRPDLAHAYGTAVDKAIKEGRDPSSDPVVQHLADAITSIQKQTADKGVKESQPIMGPDGKPHVYALDEKGNKVADLGVHYEKPVQAPGVTVVVPDPNNPGGGRVERLTAGSTVAPGAQTATQFGSINTPTTQQRNVGAQAALVHEQTPQLLAQIDQMKDSLGPVEGRWNEFMQGKVGMDNPQMADLRANLLMYSSAVALMHARGRLPENLREEFDRAINAPKQTAGNLKAVINRIDQWTSANMNAMQGRNQTQPQGGGASGSIYARDPQGKLHQAPAGTALPQGWKQENR